MQWQHWYAMQWQRERQVYGCCNLEWLLLTAGATADRVGGRGHCYNHHVDIHDDNFVNVDDDTDDAKRSRISNDAEKAI